MSVRFACFVYLFVVVFCSEDCKNNKRELTILEDYCGHVRRRVWSTVDNSTLSQFPNYAIGDSVKAVDQIIGLYDVCMIRRNSYQTENFGHRSWAWKLSDCVVDSNGVSTATITAYSTHDCTEGTGENTILKTWTITDNETRNFYDIPPLQNKEEEYWFWWFEDSAEFPGYGNSTEVFSVSCFDGKSLNDEDLNSCSNEYIHIVRYDWPNKHLSLTENHTNYTHDEMVSLLTQTNPNTGGYYAKDVETQYKVINTCLRTYSDAQFNKQYCQYDETSQTSSVYQEKWAQAEENCNETYETNKVRFINGEVKAKDCGFIEDDSFKDNVNYSCIVRTLCPYFGESGPVTRYGKCDSKNNSSNNDLGSGEIIGIVIGCLFGILVLGGILFICRASVKKETTKDRKPIMNEDDNGNNDTEMGATFD